MDYTSLILSQCRSISWRVQVARVLRKRCHKLGQRVSSVEELVQALQRGTSSSVSPQVGRALQKLYTTLMSTDDLVQRCTVNRRVNTIKYKSEFNALDQQIMDGLRILATVPHVYQAPSAGPALQEYTVEEVDDDSDEDFGSLLPVALGGAMVPAAAPGMSVFRSQPNVVRETVVLVGDENLFSHPSPGGQDTALVIFENLYRYRTQY